MKFHHYRLLPSHSWLISEDFISFRPILLRSLISMFFCLVFKTIGFKHLGLHFQIPRHHHSNLLRICSSLTLNFVVIKNFIENTFNLFFPPHPLTPILYWLIRNFNYFFMMIARQQEIFDFKIRFSFSEVLFCNYSILW